VALNDDDDDDDDDDVTTHTNLHVIIQTDYANHLTTHINHETIRNILGIQNKKYN